MSGSTPLLPYALPALVGENGHALHQYTGNEGCRMADSTAFTSNSLFFPPKTICQARLLLLQLLWDKTEGMILGERRSKRAAVESRAAVTIQQLCHIRRIAVGLIKV